MALWQKLWLLFAVIWVVVAGLQVASILAFSEGELEREKALLPLMLAVAIPAGAYFLIWGWVRLRNRRKT
ncbi:MAG: hypothetical protein M3544_13135 [Pseudomonadota bacterium]|nr:hypothetical protein [Pseudomonadota bacterium]